MESSGMTPPNLNRKKRIGRIVLIALLAVTLATSAVMTYLWYDERSTAQRLRERIAELEVTLPTPGTPTPTAPDLCSTGTATYTATVGKFALTLADGEYAIIKNHDGEGEGGPSTRVSVGTCLDAAQNLVAFPTNSQLTVTAMPRLDGTSFADWRTGRIEAVGAPSRALPDVMVDGTTAQEFAFDGLGETRKLFFENANVWYEVELYDAAPEGADVLQIREDVINGFSFTG